MKSMSTRELVIQRKYYEKQALNLKNIIRIKKKESKGNK